MTSSYRSLFVLTICVFLLTGYNFLGAAWTAPTGTPPANNTDAPINVGATGQTKAGSLGLNSLVINTDYPTIAFNDPRPGSRLLYMQNSASSYNFIGDRNDDGTIVWADDRPQAFTVYLGATTSQDYTYISNQARSKYYCNEMGGDCFTPADVVPGGGGDTITVDGQCFEPATSVSCWWNWGGSGNDSASYTINSSQDPAAYCASIGRGYLSHVTVLAQCGIGDYVWNTGTWSACSAPVQSCGTSYGTHSRTVSCRRASDNAVVADSFCTSAKPSLSAACSVSYGGCSCFTAETKVTLADGSEKNIKDVVVGDKVRGEDGMINNVIGYDRPMLGTRLLYSINAGPYFVTSEHPFLTAAGWKAISPETLYDEEPALAAEIKPGKLQIGDAILNKDGTVTTVTSIESQVAPDQQLYNLVLDGNNTYFVNGLLTHNKN